MFGLSGLTAAAHARRHDSVDKIEDGGAQYLGSFGVSVSMRDFLGRE